MFRISTMNKISVNGLDLFNRERYEIASEITNPDAILVRSAKLHDYPIPESVKAIARAGAGVNNIPIDQCTEKGIIVFNTPGANANAVKEIVIASLFLSSRRIVQGIGWCRSIIGKGDEIPGLIEKEKSNFAGPEIRGKTLGIIGLGAIGAQVANDAVSIGMRVIGFDPYISVDAAWNLSRNVERALSIDNVLSQADYLTFHIPLTDENRGIISRQKFGVMKKGIRILNFSRGGLINNEDLLAAIREGIVETYVTDFPDEELLKEEKVIGIPHLGASTPESEENCAIMAVNQIRHFLEAGNVKNSVNFPSCELPFQSKNRIIIANHNIPNMVGQITTLLAKENVNISELLNKHKGDYAYNIIDTDTPVPAGFSEKVKSIKGVIMARVLQNRSAG